MRVPVVLDRAGRAAAVVALGLLVASCGVFPGSSSGPTSASSPQPAGPASSGATGVPSPTVGGSAGATPDPSAGAAPSLASKSFTVKANFSKTRPRMRFDIVELERRGDLLELRANLTNLEQDRSVDRRWQVGDRFNGAYRDDLKVGSLAFSGSVLTDLVGKKRYFVAVDDAGGCVCSSNLEAVFVDAGQTVELSATYAAPPASTTTLDVSVPSLGTFRDLPVT